RSARRSTSCAPKDPRRSSIGCGRPGSPAPRRPVTRRAVGCSQPGRECSIGRPAPPSPARAPGTRRTPSGSACHASSPCRCRRAWVPRARRGRRGAAVVVCGAGRGAEVGGLAMRLCRRKGGVVIVGDMGLCFDLLFVYDEELVLFKSTWYGPGLYDPIYEAKG